MRIGSRPEGESAQARECFVFDAYGTLLDVDSAVRRCDPGASLPDGFSQRWRSKQLEYSWTLQAMGAYRDFATLTADALDYVIRATGAGGALRERLLASYRSLEAYSEVEEVLCALRRDGARLAVLSNGTAAMLASAFAAAGIGGFFEQTISVDEIAIYKPDPRVYHHAAARLAIPASRIRFVSANAWDAAGARRCGLRVIWVNRQKVPDEYELGDSASSVVDLRGLLRAGRDEALST
jgi:2-haloacid dehalogenase